MYGEAMKKQITYLIEKVIAQIRSADSNTASRPHSIRLT